MVTMVAREWSCGVVVVGEVVVVVVHDSGGGGIKMAVAAVTVAIE